MIEVKEEVFPLAQAFTISRGSRREAKVLTVTICRNGFYGRGECVPYARYQETPDSVRAQTLALPENISREELQSALPPGAARNAVDCALWDLEAKTQNRRVWELAGLATPVPQLTCFTLSLDKVENMQKAAFENAWRPVLKIKLGTADDMPRIEAVHRAAPKAKIIIDANEGWTADIYAELAPHLPQLGVVLVEQPLPAENDDALLDIPRPLPICADEACHDRKSLAKMHGKYDVINIKLDKAGGLTEALALRKEALAHGYDIMVGCMLGSSLAMAPAVLLTQEAMITDLDAPLLLAKDRDYALHYDAQGVHPPAPELWG